MVRVNVMDYLARLEGISRTGAVIGAQLLALGLAMLAFSLVLRVVLRRAGSVALLKRFQGRAEHLRKKLNRHLLVLFIFFAFVIMAGNGYLMTQNVDVLDLSRNWVTQRGPEFWNDLLIGFAQVVGLFIVATFAVHRIERILMGLMRRAKAYENIRANDESVEAFVFSLNSIQKSVIWLGVAYLSVVLLPFPAGAANGLLLATRIYLIVALGLLTLKAVSAIVDSLDSLASRVPEPEKLLGLYDKLRGLMPLMRRSLDAIVYVIMATLVLAQVDSIAPLASYGPRLIQSIAILFAALVVVEVCKLLIDKAMLGGGEATGAEQRRLQTIIPVFKSMVASVVYFFGFVLILRAFEFNPWPILAGAGIAGIVVGLGAQSIINDVVSGLFILSEGLYLVGDFIETGTSHGVVESIGLRTTTIRDPDGQLHIWRNGQLGEVINYSKGYTHAMVQVGVAYDSDLDHVYGVLERVGEELKAGNTDVLEPTEVHGLEDFGASELTIRTLTRVKPGRHRQVARQVRKMIKEAFEREGIEIPFPRQVIVLQAKENAGEPVTPAR